MTAGEYWVAPAFPWYPRGQGRAWARTTAGAMVRVVKGLSPEVRLGSYLYVGRAIVVGRAIRVRHMLSEPHGMCAQVS